MGDGGDPDFSRGLAFTGPADTPSPPTQGIRVVRDMSLIEFRKKLIEHFTIMWHQRRVQWPSRNGIVEWASAHCD
jgi:hypothetical protein